MHENLLTKVKGSFVDFQNFLYIVLVRWECGHFLGLVMQPDKGSVGTPKGSYFRVMF